MATNPVEPANETGFVRRREFLRNATAASSFLLPGDAQLNASPTQCTEITPVSDVAAVSFPSSGPDAVFTKRLPVSMVEWARERVKGVAAVEVDDYAPGGFQGALRPSPPHADINPRRAVIVSWERAKHRLVFCHEASYDPWIELTNGVGFCNQFFEGNNGWAELFNDNGRRERNSFVDIVQSGPERVWVRWSYFCVNKDDDSHPALRGTEDYITYSNGLVWRRLAYSTLMAERPEGYSWQPIDFSPLRPVGPPGATCSSATISLVITTSLVPSTSIPTAATPSFGPKAGNRDAKGTDRRCSTSRTPTASRWCYRSRRAACSP